MSSRKQSSCRVRKIERGCGGSGEEKVGIRACIYVVRSVGNRECKTTCDSIRVCKILARRLCCALSEILLTLTVWLRFRMGMIRKSIQPVHKRAKAKRLTGKTNFPTTNYDADAQCQWLRSGGKTAVSLVSLVCSSSESTDFKYRGYSLSDGHWWEVLCQAVVVVEERTENADNAYSHCIPTR